MNDAKMITTGAWQSALRVWEALQKARQQPPQQQQQQTTQHRSVAAPLVIQACKVGKNASKAAELSAEFRRSGLISSPAS